MLLFDVAASKLRTFLISATNPPTIVNRWAVDRNGCGSPFVTSTGGTNNVIVWVVGASGDQRLHGYDGDTGGVVYGGGGANELMAGTHSYSTTGIAARGRIYVAGDNKVYAFNLPAGTPTPTPTATPTATSTANSNSNSNSNCNAHATATTTSTPTTTPPPTPTSTPYCNSDGDCHANIDPNCHGNCESDSDCHSHRFRQSDAYAQTDAYCQAAGDAEAAPDSAAKAHALIGQYVDCQWFVALTNES